MNKVVDLRSDTVTKPCVNMRNAIATAEVGDDMVGEDPSVNKLQEVAAKITGKEKALFVPSATMANQLAMKSLTAPGDAVVMLKHAHVYCYESGAAPLISGVTILPTGDDNGVITKEQLVSLIPPQDPHFAPVSLLSLENTYSGNVVPLESMQELYEYCKSQNLNMHLDGARIFNASVATGIEVAKYAQYFNTITICLSKGLGAPVGALLCGDAKTIARAHRFRKLFGGAMRQAGIVAAAGVYALENNIAKLKEDHRRAKSLAEKLSKIKNVSIVNQVQTNMVFADFSKLNFTAMEIQKNLAEKNIKIFIDDKKSISRLVTHLDIDDNDIDYFVGIIEKMGSSD